jgi:hypothetical protein
MLGLLLLLVSSGQAGDMLAPVGVAVICLPSAACERSSCLAAGDRGQPAHDQGRCN